MIAANIPNTPANTLLVSLRGQITLPATLRRQLGIAPGGVVIAEEKEGGLWLRPATVLPTRVYTDEQIARWTAADTFKNASERREFARKLKAMARRFGIKPAAKAA